MSERAGSLFAGGEGATLLGSVKVSPDGLSYAYSYLQPRSDLYLVEGLR